MRIVLLILLLLPNVSFAWNATGHKVVAKLAWDQLTPTERTKVSDILKNHPHYTTFLSKDSSFTNEQIFLQAATWPDFVRAPGPNHKYNHSDWHYTNIPLNDDERQIKIPVINIVSQLPKCIDYLKSGTREEQAIYLCWVEHLVGDIHQPLHCTTLYNATFPDGDRGGNLSIIRVGRRVMQMHHYWDCLLGEDDFLFNDTIKKITERGDGGMALDWDDPKDWAKESFALAKKYGYLDGKLQPVADHHIPAPTVPDDYSKNAHDCAQFCAAKAGSRLAKILKETLK